LFVWAQQVSDRWALESFASPNDVGLYVGLFQIGYMPILLASGVFMNFLSPILFNRARDISEIKDILELQKTTKNIAAIGLILTLITFILVFFSHKWIFKIFLNINYNEISFLMPWMVLAGGLNASYHILGSIIMVVLKTNQLVKYQIILSLITVILNTVFAKFWGLEGVVISVVVSSFTYCLFMYIFSGKVVSEALKPMNSKL
jgi:O-antigen/teichoic acid export membrane protein